MEDRKSKDPSKTDPPARWLDEAFEGSRLLSRQRHLELLTFELLGLIEMFAPQEVFDSEAYENVRVLYKALAHGRRPDGSSYR